MLVAVGLIPRFAGKTHTARYVLLYEEMVIFGTLAGCFVTIFPEYSQWGNYLREHFPEQMRLWTAADRKSTRLNSSHSRKSRMPSSA